MLIKRRNFIQIGSLATGTLLVPQFLKAFEKPAMVPSGNKVVVVIQLSGGNDGLNTVIPYRNDIYYRQRPRLGIKKEQALSDTDEAGLHPSLTLSVSFMMRADGGTEQCGLSQSRPFTFPEHGYLANRQPEQ